MSGKREGSRMSLAVVRCPGCRGASRVSADALGQMVGCPRCQMPFVAEEEVPVVAPVARPAPRRSAAPVAPSRPRPIDDEPPEPEPTAADAVPDPEHDPHERPTAGLPVSVLVGLALVPFGIPLLWRLAPLVTGQGPTLSLAVPVALAVAASALCLGVVYTIDWTAMTRVKGVLMLVGLSYLSAAGLFFLKKDLMDRIRDWADPSRQWSVVSLTSDKPAGRCQVQMPGTAQSAKPSTQPLGEFASIEDERVSVYAPDLTDGPRYEYRIAMSRPAARKVADADWFAGVGAHLQKTTGPPTGGPREIGFANGIVKEWEFQVGESNRIVRVYVVGDRAYYLHVQGPQLRPGDRDVEQFFRTFTVN